MLASRLWFLWPFSALQLLSHLELPLSPLIFNSGISQKRGPAISQFLSLSQDHQEVMLRFIICVPNCIGEMTEVRMAQISHWNLNRPFLNRKVTVKLNEIAFRKLSYIWMQYTKDRFRFNTEFFGNPEGRERIWERKVQSFNFNWATSVGIQIEERVNKHRVMEVSPWDRSGESEEI